MSKVGKQPVQFDASKVSVEITEGGDYHHQLVNLSGPNGSLELSVRKGVEIKLAENELVVERKSDSKHAKAYHGLYRTLLANMVKGVSEGFERKLEIHGTGYRGELKGPGKIELKLGYSHPVVYEARAGIDLKIDDQTLITVSGFDKQLVGQTAAEIRELKKPEPYKGKGIRYQGEQIKRKSGKAGAAAG